MESGGETVTIQAYNYDKFFDAIHVANTDKWDEKNQTYTSWKPLGNGVKRTEYAENNAKASDMVRQFAITWYLDDEAAKLVKTNGEEEDEGKKEEIENRSTEMLYDEALNAALAKAYDYLAPFFRYDLTTSCTPFPGTGRQTAGRIRIRTPYARIGKPGQKGRKAITTACPPIFPTEPM